LLAGQGEQTRLVVEVQALVSYWLELQGAVQLVEDTPLQKLLAGQGEHWRFVVLVQARVSYWLKLHATLHPTADTPLQ